MGEGGGSVRCRDGDTARNCGGGHEGACRIVNRDEFVVPADALESGMDGKMALGASRDDLDKFRESETSRRLGHFIEFLRIRHHADFTHLRAGLEGEEGTQQHALAGESGGEFVESHPPAAPGGDEDGGDPHAVLEKGRDLSPAWP